MGRHSAGNGGGHPSHGCCVSGSILCTNHSVIKKLFWFTFLPDSFILLSSTKNEKTLRNFCCQGQFYKIYSTEKFFFFLFLRRQKSPFLYFLSWWTWLVFILTLVINIPKSQCEANVCLQLKKNCLRHWWLKVTIFDGCQISLWQEIKENCFHLDLTMSPCQRILS